MSTTVPQTLSRENLVNVELLLRGCSSLKDAEQQLTRITPMPSKALRWGLWDGWSGRSHSTDGLYYTCDSETPQAEKQLREYEEGYATGQRLRRESRESS